MLSLRDPETQKRGLVMVVSFMQKTDCERVRANGFDGAWKYPKLFLGIPIHVAALHMGYDSMEWAPVHAILTITLSLLTRIRLRAYYGSQEDWLDSMKRYGIQADQLPLREDGVIERSEHRRSLEARRKKERLTYPSRTRVGVPGRFDVIFGKGSRFQNHVGNVNFRSFIAACRKTYDKTERGEKHVLIQEIVDTVKQSSGLFLKADDGDWIVVDDAAAAYKVGAAFRTLRARDELY